MGQSNGTAAPARERIGPSLMATCDQCEDMLALAMPTAPISPVLVCRRCRIYYPLAEVLIAMRRELRRRPRQG